jgi:hypothetical protein
MTATISKGAGDVLNHRGLRLNVPFRQIPRAECERLLSEHTVGRVAWNAPDGPELVPVNYACYNKTIVFPDCA